jgi:hypothetical protein
MGDRFPLVRKISKENRVVLECLVVRISGIKGPSKGEITQTAREAFGILFSLLGTYNLLISKLISTCNADCASKCEDQVVVKL